MNKTLLTIIAVTVLLLVTGVGWLIIMNKTPEGSEVIPHEPIPPPAELPVAPEEEIPPPIDGPLPIVEPPPIIEPSPGSGEEIPDDTASLPPATTECIVTGCSGQVCEEGTIITTCEYRSEYACYKDATCERQSDGKCGWTQTEALQQCITEKKNGGELPNVIQ